MCLFSDPVVPVDFVLIPGNNIQLMCQAHSNLAQVQWRLSNQVLGSNNKYYIHSWGLLIVGVSGSDAGLYICDSVEQINGRTHNRTVAAYQLQLSSGSTTPGNKVTKSSDSQGPTISKPGLAPNPGGGDHLSPENQSDSSEGIGGLEVAVILLSLFCLCLMTVVFWNWTKGRLRCFKLPESSSQSQVKRQSVEYMHIQNRTSETKPRGPESVRPFSTNNNHSVVDFKGNGGHHFAQMPNVATLDQLGYINDESEI